MSATTHVVLAEWDTEAGVWFVKASDIPGLAVEAETLEAFTEIVCDLAPDLLDAGGSDADIPIWVKAETLACARRQPA